MCLSAVDKKPKRRFGVGYKLAEMRDGQFLSCDYGLRIGMIAYPLNTWITDNEDYSITASNGQQYRTGFHISLSEEHIRALVERNNAHISNLVTIKCRFRKVVASNMEGDTFYGPVVVARELMNLGKL